MESKAKPTSEAGSAASKPLSFLERARLARGQPPAPEPNSLKNSMEQLNTIQRENEEAMNRGNTRTQESEKRNADQINTDSVPSSMKSGYKPTASIAPTKPTIFKENSNTNLNSNSNLPKRRRAGESPNDDYQPS